MFNYAPTYAYMPMYWNRGLSKERKPDISSNFGLNCFLYSFIYFVHLTRPQRPAHGTVPFQVAITRGTHRVCRWLERTHSVKRIVEEFASSNA
jgi:hypothetical protein